MTTVEQSSALREGIREFVQQNFMYLHPELALQDDDDLLALGIVDSMGFVELVDQVQARCGLTIPDKDITEANFGSIAAIVSYAEGKRAR